VEERKTGLQGCGHGQGAEAAPARAGGVPLPLSA